MGFTDFAANAGMSMLEKWLSTRSYITGYTPSQADVTCFKSFSAAPDATKYPHASRWYKHVASYEEEFGSLEGDKAKAFSEYGPTAAEAEEGGAPVPAAAAEDDDDEVDLFGSDDEEEDAAAEALKQKRLEEYNAKKASKGPKPAAKSIVTLDVKPWDDETDMKELEASVRSIQKDGLVWGLSQLVAVGFGIKKLQINLVIEDEKISLDELQEQIAEFEDFVQSSDIAAMQKL